MVQRSTFTNYRIEIRQEDLERLVKQVEKNPNNLELMDWTAFALYSNNMFEEAIRFYNLLVKKDPTNPSYHYYLGNAFFKNGLYGAARAEWQQVIHLDENHKFTQRCHRKLALLKGKDG